MSGFPSPATDYVESRLTPESICGINANSLVIETSSGYAVVEKGSRPKAGEYVLVNWLGRNYFARPAGKVLITEDGEEIEGDELAQYNLWLDYLDALEAVNTSTAPDITWPQQPE